VKSSNGGITKPGKAERDRKDRISSRLRSPAEGNPESRLLYFEVPEIRERGSEPDF